MGRRVQFSKVMYLGGHPKHEKPSRNATVIINDRGIHVMPTQVWKKFTIPWGEVTSVAVEGPDQAAKRVTVTRLLALNIFAFAAQKTTSEAYFHVETSAYAVGFHLPKTSAGEVRGQLGEWIGRVPEAPAQPASSVAGELEKLAGLRRDGFLSAEEFERQKARLLQG